MWFLIVQTALGDDIMLATVGFQAVRKNEFV